MTIERSLPVLNTEYRLRISGPGGRDGGTTAKSTCRQPVRELFRRAVQSRLTALSTLESEETTELPAWTSSLSLCRLYKWIWFFELSATVAGVSAVLTRRSMPGGAGGENGIPDGDVVVDLKLQESFEVRNLLSRRYLEPVEKLDNGAALS